MENFALSKKEGSLIYYFKCKDKTGHTSTSCKPDAMRFKNKSEAIDYNHKELYGEFEVVNLSHEKTTTTEN